MCYYYDSYLHFEDLKCRQSELRCDLCTKYTVVVFQKCKIFPKNFYIDYVNLIF